MVAVATTPPRTRATTRRADPVRCCHHWLVDSPNGPRARGRCRRCGRTALFPTSLEGAARADARSRRKAAAGGEAYAGLDEPSLSP